MTPKKLTIALFLFLSCQSISSEHGKNLKDEKVYIKNLTARSIASQIKNALEKMRELMKTGNESMGVPVLDPFKLDFYNLSVTVNDSSIKGSVNDLSVVQLSDYIVQKADFKIGSFMLSIDLMWPVIEGTTKYDVEGTFMNKIPFYGQGDLTFKVKNFRYATDAKLKLDGRTRKIQILNFQGTSISMESIKVDITGLLGHEDLSKLVSKAVSDLLPDTLQDYQEEVTSVVDKISLAAGNKILANYTLGSFSNLKYTF